MYMTHDLLGTEGAVICYKSQGEMVNFHSSQVSLHSHMAKRKDHSQSDGEASVKRIHGKAVESSMAPAAEEVPTGMDWAPCCEANERDHILLAGTRPPRRAKADALNNAGKHFRVPAMYCTHLLCSVEAAGTWWFAEEGSKDDDDAQGCA